MEPRAIARVLLGPIDHPSQARWVMRAGALTFLVGFFCLWGLAGLQVEFGSAGRSPPHDPSPLWWVALQWVILLGVPAWLALASSRIAAVLLVAGSGALTALTLLFAFIELRFAPWRDLVTASPGGVQLLLLKFAWGLLAVFWVFATLLAWRAARAAFAYRRLRSAKAPAGLADAFG